MNSYSGNAKFDQMASKAMREITTISHLAASDSLTAQRIFNRFSVEVARASSVSSASRSKVSAAANSWSGVQLGLRRAAADNLQVSGFRTEVANLYNQVDSQAAQLRSASGSSAACRAAMLAQDYTNAAASVEALASERAHGLKSDYMRKAPGWSGSARHHNRSRLGEIQLLEVDSENQMIVHRTLRHSLGTAFSLKVIRALIPKGYRLVKVLTGRHVKTYQSRLQRVLVEIKKQRASDPLRRLFSQPKVQSVPRPVTLRKGVIKISYVNHDGVVVDFRKAIGKVGQACLIQQLRQSVPKGYRFVKILYGHQVQRFRDNQQEIVIEITRLRNRHRPVSAAHSERSALASLGSSRASSVVSSNTSRSSAESTQSGSSTTAGHQLGQAFIDGYNYRIMGMANPAQTERARRGQRSADRYVMGIAAARRKQPPQSRQADYLAGYRTFQRVNHQRHLPKSMTFSRVLLLLFGQMVSYAGRS